MDACMHVREALWADDDHKRKSQAKRNETEMRIIADALTHVDHEEDDDERRDCLLHRAQQRVRHAHRQQQELCFVWCGAMDIWMGGWMDKHMDVRPHLVKAHHQIDRPDPPTNPPTCGPSYTSSKKM
jgi:mannose-6-phosphate isomerase-like protein (cupin superfamily)